MIQPAMRRFGDAVDLELDFDQPDRPGLVTALLAQCSAGGDAAFWWSQAVGVRSAALLRLLAATEAAQLLGLTARCSNAPCGAAFEFELPLPELVDSAGATMQLRVALDATRCVTLRRPTGDDLRAWRNQHFASRDEAVRTMLATLLLEGQLGPDDEARLSEAIAALDPLVAFAVDCACPACNAPNSVAVDLEALTLARLAARQRSLLREVHCLASHYGWTEQEALAIPVRRRAQYLALCEEAR